MRLIDANELTEMIWRKQVDTRERISNIIARQPTVKTDVQADFDKMRLIDADELTEAVWRERLDTRKRIADLIARQPTIELADETEHECRTDREIE